MGRPPPQRATHANVSPNGAGLRRGIAYLNSLNSKLAITDFSQVLSESTEELSARQTNAIRPVADTIRLPVDNVQVLSSNPQCASAFNNRGIAHKQVGKIEQVMRQLLHL